VITLTQRYQMVEGTYTPNTGQPVGVKGRLRGDAITVTLGQNEYSGTVTGDRIEGAAKTTPTARIVATRIE
jgi:hypothetical protein